MQKAYSDIHILRKFTSPRFTLKELVKNVLQEEGIWIQKKGIRCKKQQ
jgi:hypothetical protein